MREAACLGVCFIAIQSRPFPSRESIAPPICLVGSSTERAQVCQVSVFRDFECAEDAKVEVSAARDRETIGVMHQGRLRDHR